MDSHDILKYFLPKELTDYFELIDINSQEAQLVICLDEKNIKPPEYIDVELESKGFSSPVYIHDFPIRDKQVMLKIRKRKWRDKKTGKTYTRSWDLKHEGTSYTKEFAAFLKKMLGHQTG